LKKKTEGKKNPSGITIREQIPVRKKFILIRGKKGEKKGVWEVKRKSGGAGGAKAI